MDVYFSKQPVGGIAAPKKRSVTALRDSTGSRDGAAQVCNRLGCCGRLNHTKGTKNKCLEKPKPLKPFILSSSGKEVTGSSSKNCSSVTNVKKSLLESQKKLSCKIERIPTESSSVPDLSEIQELNASARSHTERKLKSRNTESNKVILMPVSRTIEVASSSTRTRKVYHEKYGVVNQASQSGCSVSSAPQITDQGVMENSERSRYGLKSLRFNSISDVYRQGDPNSESNNGRRRNTVKKKFTQGESSSSSKGKRISGLSASDGRVSVSASGISVSDPGHSRNRTACRESSVSSVRTRRSVNVDTLAGSINQLHGDNLPLVQPTNMIPDISQPEILRPSAESELTESSPNGGRSTSDTSSTRISVTSTDHPIVRFMNHNGTHHYNIDGIADVLLALDRIEQDEELTYEQLLSLEANLFLGGLNFYDQHMDMRLDIDNMSYEELLVLEEKMGTVSTALSEEELSKCIRISTYEYMHIEDGRMRCSWGADDNKCSICQEEFVRGDEIGRLGCGHGYHTLCINQWLRLKNWCPICKASPESSSFC